MHIKYSLLHKHLHILHAHALHLHMLSTMHVLPIKCSLEKFPCITKGLRISFGANRHPRQLCGDHPLVQAAHIIMKQSEQKVSIWLDGVVQPHSKPSKKHSPYYRAYHKRRSAQRPGKRARQRHQHPHNERMDEYMQWRNIEHMVKQEEVPDSFFGSHLPDCRDVTCGECGIENE